MTLKEMMDRVKEIAEENEMEYDFLGLRFEDKERNEGDVITENSRHNQDREDEREFPEYGTEEYEDMMELDGVSAWTLNEPATTKVRSFEADKDISQVYPTKHAYIIGSDDSMDDMDWGPDDGEIVLKDATVIAKIF